MNLATSEIDDIARKLEKRGLLRLALQSMCSHIGMPQTHQAIRSGMCALHPWDWAWGIRRALLALP